jgi:hypothetical protein
VAIRSPHLHRVIVLVDHPSCTPQDLELFDANLDAARDGLAVMLQVDGRCRSIVLACLFISIQWEDQARLVTLAL